MKWTWNLYATCTRKYVYFGEICTTGKKFTLPPAMVGVTNITSGPGHLVTKNAGLLKKKKTFWKKQDRQLQIKYLWEKRWHGADNGNEKSDINLFLRQNSPPPLTPRLRPHKFSMYSKHFRVGYLFLFSVTKCSRVILMQFRRLNDCLRPLSKLLLPNLTKIQKQIN